MPSLVHAPQFTPHSFKKNFVANCCRRRFGYTLIELLVVLGILALTVGGITMFLTSILRGTNKANTQTEVKQNGQAVLDSLERQIRGAVLVEKTVAGELKVVRESGDYLFIACQGPSGVGISSKNSRIAVQTVSSVSPPASPVPRAAGWVSVSNDNANTGISIDNCQLNVYTAGFSPEGKPIPAVVSISFEAKKAGLRADISAISKFQTTISLRRY